MGVLNDREITRLSVEGFRHPADDRKIREAWMNSKPAPGLPMRKMIEPFAENKKRSGKISYGVSSYGYDFRIGNTFQVFKPYAMPLLDPGTVVDPKAFDKNVAETITVEDGKAILLPPNSFTLGVAVERFCIPRDILTVCLGKSTYARCGIIVNVTPFEPEWEGHPTVELTNTGPTPVKVYAGEGIAQLLFLQAGLDTSKLLEYLLQKTTTRVERDCGAQQRLEALQLVCDTSYADKGGKYNHQPNEIVHSKVD